MAELIESLSLSFDIENKASHRGLMLEHIDDSEYAKPSQFLSIAIKQTLDHIFDYHQYIVDQRHHLLWV